MDIAEEKRGLSAPVENWMHILKHDIFLNKLRQRPGIVTRKYMQIYKVESVNLLEWINQWNGKATLSDECSEIDKSETDSTHAQENLDKKGNSAG